jgi:hypothetical protein
MTFNVGSSHVTASKSKSPKEILVIEMILLKKYGKN